MKIWVAYEVEYDEEAGYHGECGCDGYASIRAFSSKRKAEMFLKRNRFFTIKVVKIDKE